MLSHMVAAMLEEQVNQWTPFKVQLLHVHELFMLWLKTLIHLAARFKGAYQLKKGGCFAANKNFWRKKGAVIVFLL